MNYQEITELYRQIGREFHALGADRVNLMEAKTLTDTVCEMRMEIVLWGVADKDAFVEKTQETWPMIDMRILLADEHDDRMREFDEDGIVL